MSNKHKILLFLLLHITVYCNSQNSRQKAFDKYLDDISIDSQITELRNCLRDSLKSWIDKGLYYVLFLEKASWKIDDAIFLNDKKDKALLLVPVQPNDALFGVDFVKIIAAEKVNEKWRFYYASYPISVFYRKDIKKNTLDSIGRLARWELINDGFIKCKPSCKINHDYVESDVWFTDKRRKMHEKFLSNTLLIHPLEKPGESLY